jgi:hypothetical protein
MAAEIQSLHHLPKSAEGGAQGRSWRSLHPLGRKSPPEAAVCIRKPSPKCLQGAYIGDLRRLCKQRRPLKDHFNTLISLRKSGAGEGIRTLDPNLGKVVLYP